MQHLIVVAHPLQHSMTMKLAHAYALELQQLGHSQRTHDLYHMGFNPVMGAHELEPLSIGHAADADVAQAQQEVRSAGRRTRLGARPSLRTAALCRECRGLPGSAQRACGY